MLDWLLDRVQQVEPVRTIVVATSSRADDDEIAQYAESRRLSCFRGSLDDVLSRFEGVADEYELDAMVRVSADSPFLDPAVVREAIHVFERSDADLVTNVFPRSFPKGQSVEVITRKAIKRANELATSADREHVTSHFYAYPDRYRILNFVSRQPLSEIQMSVDTTEDFALAEKMFLAMTRPHLDYDLDALLQLRADLLHIAGEDS